jgi:hypothetical protein
MDIEKPKQENQKAEVQKRCQAAIRQMTVGCKKSLCFNDYCKKNPGNIGVIRDFKEMTNKEILEYTLKNQLTLVLCEDYAGESEFNDSQIEKMCEERNAAFFEDEYVKHFTRIESIGFGFRKPGAPQSDDGIDFEKVKKVNAVVQNLTQTARCNMIENIKSFRVRAADSRPTNSR